MNAELSTLNSQRSSGDLHVGDMVMIDGHQHMVLRLLDGGKVRVRQWPILEAPRAFEVDAEGLEVVPPEHLAPVENLTHTTRNEDEAGRVPRRDARSGGRPAPAADQGGTNE